MCNKSCGNRFIPCWARSEYFDPACVWHDKYYREGIDRKKADGIFLMDMLEIHEYRGGSEFRKLHAYFYYYMVRAFGWTTYGKE